MLADYYSHVFILIYPLDEFFFKEMKTGSPSKISSCCLCVWCKSRELEGREVQDSQHQWWKPSLQTLPAVSNWAESHLELFILFGLNPGPREEDLIRLLSWIAAWLLIRRIWLVHISRWVFPGCSIERYWTEQHMEFCQTSTSEVLCESMWSVFRWLG